MPPRTAPIPDRIDQARANWERINRAIRDSLSEVTLAEMAHTIPAAFLLPGEHLTAARQ